MKDLRNCVFIAFMVQDTYDLYNLHNYIKLHLNNTVDVNTVSDIVRGLKKENTLVYQDNLYSMTEKGRYIINDHKRFYDKKVAIIVRIFRKLRDRRRGFRRTYRLKETRNEQATLRRHCIANRPNICVLCYKRLPLCLLETAHLKPRPTLNAIEIADENVAELMCRYCHPLYDAGMLGVLAGALCVSSELSLEAYDLVYTDGMVIEAYCESNKKYFDYHYRNVYRGSDSVDGDNNHTGSVSIR
jgi:hypothetical protein